MIADKDVTREYFKRLATRHGLVVLDSLNLWRQKGWKVGKKKYQIQAFAEVDFTDHGQILQAIFGMWELESAFSSQDANSRVLTGQPWDVTSGPGSQKGSWGDITCTFPVIRRTDRVCDVGPQTANDLAWLDKYCDEPTPFSTPRTVSRKR